jgi:hypothetical protein
MVVQVQVLPCSYSLSPQVVRLIQLNLNISDLCKTTTSAI